MKRVLLLLLFVIVFIGAEAQNIQFHYDFTKARRFETTTIEMFKPDQWGSTFFFIDLDYNRNDVKGLSQAYWEISRSMKIGNSPFSVHGEFDSGFLQAKGTPVNAGFTIKPAWLGGLEYNWNSKDFTRGFGIQALYKHINHLDDASFQLTETWYLHMLNKKLTFDGFADFWKEKTPYGSYVFLSEPQLWYNFTSHLSLGSEVEFSNNFGGLDGFHVYPTIAAKWTF
ncbi:MAG: DUF5020 family protein [Bacteroidota bacterium]|nr:DUF5020 family protein [Bacteroidota bacterium]MDP4206845.1 DUF5020 family protein [Bacteroidota bacterium]